MNRAYYSENTEIFIKEDLNSILGKLCQKHTHDLNDLQRNAWIRQIEILKKTLDKIKESHIYFEFCIPRMGKRIDNVLLLNNIIYTIEFKVGETKHEHHSIEQIMDYSYDLKNFHEGSHQNKIIPILVSTKAPHVDNKLLEIRDNVYNPLLANETNLIEIINSTKSDVCSNPINPIEWETSIYKPTPTIIEAAQALYKGHDVKEISRSDSGAINLSKTANCLNRIIDDAKKSNRKVICFVTGVPGAGKTLAGLNIATERMKIAEDEHAVFLSGNGPLVEVLREALTRDQVKTEKEKDIVITKKEAAIKANAFIQNIHHFRDEGLISDKAPIEKVVVFDEAQRAWTKEQASSFMKRKKGNENFNQSEPDFLIDVMNRHQNWCTIICLIGGGQEINTGEAGLEEWFSSIKNHFNNWDIFYSDRIQLDNNYLRDKQMIEFISKKGNSEKDLHLSVSVRSFRSEKLSDFVKCLLDLNIEEAKILLHEIKLSYPIKITRNLSKAKNALKNMSVGSERYGLIASSNARRLRAVGIDVKNEISPSYWFLNGKSDIRSSYFLEEIATEFDIQGLELDWTIVGWDGDLYFDNGNWVFQNFKGTKWQNINQGLAKQYLINAYRVLLTRARQGMIIFIPDGDNSDKTRKNKYYDGTFDFLTSLGIEEL